MKYLTLEIEALTKYKTSNSLVRPTVSCGIFQEYCDNEKSKLNHQTMAEKSI